MQFAEPGPLSSPVVPASTTKQLHPFHCKEIPMTIRRWLGACAAAVVLAWPAAAAAQQSPEEVAQAYLTHFRAGEVSRVAALTHPRALESFRTVILQMVGDEDLSDSPLAEVGDVETMSGQELFVTFMGFAAEDQEFSSMFSTLEVQPLGHVAQGDSLAHVVYGARLAFMNQQAQQMMVITLRRQGSTWLVDPGDGLMNMMGGGLMTLVMSAGMQAGMAEGMGMDDGDEDHDHDEDMDEDEDDDSDPPAS
jgi:hypothetical protein